MNYRPFLIFTLLLTAAQAQGLPANGTSTPDAPPLARQIAATASREVTWKSIAPDLMSDQIRIWTFPAHLNKSKNLIPTLAVAGAATGLILADSTSAGFFRNTDSFHSFNSVVSGNRTKWAILAAPASFYALSLIRHDSYGQSTAMLAGEALVDTEIITRLTKRITGRLSPNAVPANGSFRNTWFQTPNGVFPSEHTATAFAVAAVLANRYRSHKWVPFVAYGAAGLIGFSTMTVSGHYGSDVLVGAALGYSITKFVVLHRPRRTEAEALLVNAAAAQR